MSLESKGALHGITLFGLIPTGAELQFRLLSQITLCAFRVGFSHSGWASHCKKLFIIFVTHCHCQSVLRLFIRYILQHIVNKVLNVYNIILTGSFVVLCWTSIQCYFQVHCDVSSDEISQWNSSRPGSDQYSQDMWVSWSSAFIILLLLMYVKWFDLVASDWSE